VTPEELIDFYPRLYHMAESGSWPSIRRYGLLSTGALLDLFEVAGPSRDLIVRQRRTTSMVLRHPDRGTAVVRDQLPLSEDLLSRCLTDMTLAEWLATLNSRVFFWLTRENLNKLLCARAYRDREHDVLVVDTAELVSRYEDMITLSPINSGSTLYNAQPRGSQTFLPIPAYPFADRRRRRGPSAAVVELAVDRGVPAVGEVTLRVEQRRCEQLLKVIWEP
jgi:hypothetical protein